MEDKDIPGFELLSDDEVAELEECETRKEEACNARREREQDQATEAASIFGAFPKE